MEISKIKEQLKNSEKNYHNLNTALANVPIDDPDRQQMLKDKLAVACRIEQLKKQLQFRESENLINETYDYAAR